MEKCPESFRRQATATDNTVAVQCFWGFIFFFASFYINPFLFTFTTVFCEYARSVCYSQKLLDLEVKWLTSEKLFSADISPTHRSNLA